MKWIVWWALIAALFGVLVIQIRKTHNNVCTTFEDYYSDRDNNSNCYYNPEYDLKVPEIILGRGYPLETYHVTTEDGYILTVFRITHGKDSADKKPGPPVFIQHGFSMNSASFVNTGNKSLSFILADAGYDVWLGNYRGTLYSRNHSHLSDTDSEFWNFSFHEMGLYDAPAQLDLVYSITKQKIIFVGFSMGAGISYIYGITYPDAAYDKIKIIIGLAPMSFLKNCNPLVTIASWIAVYTEPLLQALTNGEFYPRGSSRSSLLKTLCAPFPFQMNICQILDMAVLGIDYAQNDPETLLTTILQNRDAVSIKCLVHTAQLVTQGGFKQFDYGAEINAKTYGSSEPPSYDLSKLRIPVYVIRGENDLLIRKENVEKFYELLPDELMPYDIYVVKYDNFNHADFLSSRDVVPLLYNHIVDFIRNLV